MFGFLDNFSLKKRLLDAELEVQVLRRRVDDLELAFSQAKKKKIFKEEQQDEKPKDLYSSVILPER